MLRIRAETPRDYARIAEINNLAFNARAMEPALVALLRQFHSFDPDLSLVAEQDGVIVGHVMFSKQIMRLMGEDVPVVNLAPIAVAPHYQKRGVGRALIEAGHEVARLQGYGISMLLGHPEYYPRFGYITSLYGASNLTVEVSGVSEQPLETRTPQAEDVPALKALWYHEEADVDFSIFPGNTLLDWLSVSTDIQNTVYLRGDQIVGYSRHGRGMVQYFLAADHQAARAMAVQLAAGRSSVDLPLHPNSASSAAFDSQPAAKAWSAGMAAPLCQETPLADYRHALNEQERVAGRVLWPVAFEV